MQMKTKNESGMALIAVLLILVLMGAMLQTFIVNIINSQKMIGMDMRTERTDRINQPKPPP
jgi:type II secretory pathway component PulK